MMMWTSPSLVFGAAQKSSTHLPMSIAVLRQRAQHRHEFVAVHQREIPCRRNAPPPRSRNRDAAGHAPSRHSRRSSCRTRRACPRRRSRTVCSTNGTASLQQEIVPVPHRGRVHILVAAELREAIRKRDHARRHRARADQPVEPLGHVLGEILPVGVRRPAGGEAHEIDQQRQASAVMARRHIDIDRSARVGSPSRLVLSAALSRVRR